MRNGMASRYCVRRLHAVEMPSHLRGVRAAYAHRGSRGGERGTPVTLCSQIVWTAFGRNCAIMLCRRLQVHISEDVSMPLIGFGTAGLGNQTQKAVQIALASGYRLIDSAQVRIAPPALEPRSRASYHMITCDAMSCRHQSGIGKRQWARLSGTAAWTVRTYF
jgi:hypothetical protein